MANLGGLLGCSSCLDISLVWWSRDDKLAEQVTGQQGGEGRHLLVYEHWRRGAGGRNDCQQAVREPVNRFSTALPLAFEGLRGARVYVREGDRLSQVDRHAGP